MTENEFQTCLRHHLARNANVSAWLGRQNAKRSDPNDVMPTKAEIVDGWRHTWIDLHFDAVMKAIDRFADGELDFSDKGFDCHPRDIRREAKASVSLPNRYQQMGGQPTVKCQTCEDSGLVTFWSADAVKWAHDMAACDFPDFEEELDVPEATLEFLASLPHLMGRAGTIPSTKTRTLADCSQWLEAVRRYNLKIHESGLCNCDAGLFKRFSVKMQVYNPQRHVLYDPLNPQALIDFARKGAGVDFVAAQGLEF